MSALPAPLYLRLSTPFRLLELHSPNLALFVLLHFASPSPFRSRSRSHQIWSRYQQSRGHFLQPSSPRLSSPPSLPCRPRVSLRRDVQPLRLLSSILPRVMHIIKTLTRLRSTRAPKRSCPSIACSMLRCVWRRRRGGFQPDSLHHYSSCPSALNLKPSRLSRCCCRSPGASLDLPS